MKLLSHCAIGSVEVEAILSDKTCGSVLNEGCWSMHMESICLPSIYLNVVEFTRSHLNVYTCVVTV